MCFFIGKVISHLMDTSISKRDASLSRVGPCSSTVSLFVGLLIAQTHPNLVPVPARENFLFTLYG